MPADGFHDLLRRAQSGERAALDDLLSEIRPYVMAVAREVTDAGRASRSASDLVQDAELRAWRKLEEFHGGESDEEVRARFRAWMAQIVRRLGLDLQRARRAGKRAIPGGRFVPIRAGRSGNGVDPVAESATASARLRSRERAERTREALDRVPDPKNREIIRLFFFEGLPLPRVAERVGLNYEAVKKRFRSTLARLEASLHDLAGDP